MNGSTVITAARRPALSHVHPRAARASCGLAMVAALAITLVTTVFAAPASAAAPTASTVDVVELSASGARLRGSVNPGGEATRFWFEYGKTDSYGSSVPLAKDGSAGSGSDAVVVSQAVHGLEPGTDYHFRVVASNGSGTVEGADGVFTTRRPAGECPNAAIRREQGSEFLPDCRAYEQVTPVDKAGQTMGMEQVPAVHLTVDPAGDSVLYTGLYGVPPANAPSRSAFLASRGPLGWSNEGLFPAPGPNQSGMGIPGSDMALLAGTPDGRMIAYWDATTVPFGSLNVRRADGSIVRIADATMTIGPFGNNPGQAFAMGFSPDGSRLYLTSRQRLGPAADLPAGTGDILYEWVDDGGQGSLNVVNRTNDPTVTLLSTSSASLGGRPVATALALGTDRGGHRNAVSDGSDGHRRVFFQNPAPASATTLTGGPIYMREDASRTVEISAPEGANPQATQRLFLDASEDGSKVFFWAGSKLTDDAPAGPGIYRYDVSPDGPGDLVFVASAAPVGSTPPTALASPDGENLLFADGPNNAKVSVSGDVRPVIGANVVSGRVRDNGQPTLAIAIRDDRCPSATVTPDGRFFAFVAGGGTNVSVYRYDTVSGELVDVARVPSPPVGPQRHNTPTSLFSAHCDSNAVPRPYKSKLISDDGRRVYFSSGNALVAGDASPRYDAYEWFDDGTADGRVSLLTKSTGGGDSSFIATNRSAETVYVMSSGDPLVPSDGDQVPDIYAVRMGGGFAERERVGCRGDGCQGGHAARGALARPGSGSAQGAGDIADRRVSLSIALAAVERARLAAGRRAMLRVGVGGPGVVRVTGRARIGGASRVVVRAGKRVGSAGRVAVGLRLSPAARKRLARGGRLRLVLSARLSGAPARRLALTLRRPK